MKLIRRVAVDTEGTGLHAFLGDHPFTFQTADDNLNIGFWRAPVDPFTRVVNWSDLPGPWSLLANKDVTKVFHNAKHDIQAAEAIGKGINGRIEDTMLMTKVLFSGARAGLKDLGEEWLGVKKDDEIVLHEAVKVARAEAKLLGWKIADDSGRWGDEPHMADFWLPQVSEQLERYARLDAERTMLLFHLLNPMLDEDPRLRAHYDLELKLLRAVIDMERTGVRCHRDWCHFEISRAKLRVKQHASRLAALLAESGFKPLEKAGSKSLAVFNPNSPKQVRRLVYDHLKFPVKTYTDKGAPSVAGKVLQTMKHPIIQELSSVKLQTKAQTFFQSYLLHAVPDPITNGLTDVVHPSFSQVTAATFRFSCKAPNLQQVPDAYSRYGFEALQARTVFGPRPGKIWLHVDWSQIQMWIFAADSGDPNMLADLMTGSLHEATANRVFGNGRDIVAEEAAKGIRTSRTTAKMLNFGVVFCMGEETTAEYLGCTRQEAKTYRDFYYKQYTHIRPFMDRTIALAKREGCIWNRYGWKLDVDRDMAYRAVNYYVQSEEAAHVKLKMIWLHEYYKANNLDAQLVLTNHDEIVTECVEAEILPHLSIIKDELENHHGVFPEFPKLPIEFKVTRDKWSKQEKLNYELRPV